MLIEAKLTKHQYNIVRKQASEKFPSYKQVQVAKKLCYPDQEFIKVTESELASDIKSYGNANSKFTKRRY